ncbi:hypothetical protein GJ496_005698 [Pomphorhynchus laevis]|nr:hypothetical protein GJ496_005698 [Pomphorhynchus laevis]
MEIRQDKLNKNRKNDSDAFYFLKDAATSLRLIDSTKVDDVPSAGSTNNTTGDDRRPKAKFTHSEKPDSINRRSAVFKSKLRFSVFINSSESLKLNNSNTNPANIVLIMKNVSKLKHQEQQLEDSKFNHSVMSSSEFLTSIRGRDATDFDDCLRNNTSKLTHSSFSPKSVASDAIVDMPTVHITGKNVNIEDNLRPRSHNTLGWIKKFGGNFNRRTGFVKKIDSKEQNEPTQKIHIFCNKDVRIIEDSIKSNTKKKFAISDIIQHVSRLADNDCQIILLPDEEFWSETASGEGDIHRTSVFLSLLNIDQSAKIYENEFCKKKHLNYAIEDKYKNKIILSILQDNYDISQFRTIVRTNEKILPGKIDRGNIQQPMSLEQILRFTLPDVSVSSYKLLQGDQIPNKIAIYDNQTISNCFKFGILYQKAYQITEEEMYENVDHSESMQRFLDFIAEPISLQNHKGFCGGLDNKYGLTGNNSYYSKFEGNEIMFHVSTLLPHCPSDPQQIERKRHIGNDIVTIIFQEPGAHFCPSVISSQFLQVYICVQPVDADSYRVAVAAKSNISRFGPFIEGVGQYRKDDMFRKCLFSKLINAQIAACNSTGKIGSMLRKRRNMLFDQLFEELKNSKSITNRNHVRSKSVDVHNYSTDDDYCYRSPVS